MIRFLVFLEFSTVRTLMGRSFLIKKPTEYILQIKSPSLYSTHFKESIFFYSV